MSRLAGMVRASLARPIVWAGAPPSDDLRGLPPLATWDPFLQRILPIVFAVSTGFQLTKYVVVPEGIGFDARLYVTAAREWLSGGDPWSVSSLGIPFGAPPPTLLAFVPFTPLPDALVAAIWVLGSFALATLAIRALHLPWWWICFWPIVDGAMIGNPDIAVLALLVIAGHRLDALAPVLKIYAVLPLLAERRWKSLAAFALILLVTAPILPWGRWIAALPTISLGLQRFAGTTSVSGDPILMVVGIVVLASLAYRRAGWLAVPLLWPWTQTHYLALSVPALTPLLAILWSVPGLPPLVTLLSVTLVAIGYRLFPVREALGSPRRDPLWPPRSRAGRPNSVAVTPEPHEGS